MRVIQEDTPPSSINGDEIGSMHEDDDEIIYLDEVLDLGDADEFMEQFQEGEMDEDEDMEPPEDLSALVFDKHSGSIFCCDLHPNGLYAATGGEDDKAYVWSVESGDVIMECVGHKDSVIYVGFSFDGAYLATADMGGLIKVWKVNLDPENKQAWEVAFEYEADDLNFGLWHFGTRVLMFGTVAGDIFVFKVPSGETKVLQGHNAKVECAKLFPDGVRLAAGYVDGSIKIWDLKTSTPAHSIPAGTHETQVTDIDIHPDNNLLASISNDGKVVLIAPTNGKVVGVMEASNDLETVAFSPDSQTSYLALGTLNGDLSIWDTARKMIRHHCTKTTDEGVVGVTKVKWVKSHIVTGCLDGSLRIYNGRTGERSVVLTGHRSEILDLCLNVEKNIVLTAADDGTARIFKCDINK